MITKIILLIILISTSLILNAQAPEPPNLRFNSINKGDLAIYFGWNRSAFSASDIHFKGSDYDFTIENASASDRQTTFAFNKYFKINSITVPQTNMGITYQLTEKVKLSFNVDHMKYVLDQDQTASVSGEIDPEYGQFGGIYNNSSTIITEELVRYEHTDGLNYIHLGYARTNGLLSVGSQAGLQLNYGIGTGVLFPKTNSRLLGKERYDDYKISGYGGSANVEAQLNITKWFFLASNLKGGFINMPNIRTSQDKSDRASQHFWFTQWNFMFGIKANLYE